MRLFRQKRGIILHPFTWIAMAFILGMVLMYLMMKGTLSVPYIGC